MSENITVQQNNNKINIQQSVNTISVNSVGIQGAPGNFIYLYNIDGGSPNTVYGGNLVIDAGGVNQ